jgi:hypothetical protein
MIDKNSSNMKFIIHNFIVNYQQRPNIFNYLCPNAFFSKRNKINNIHCQNFHNQHLQSNIHIFYEYKTPKILVLQTQYHHKRMILKTW